MVQHVWFNTFDTLEEGVFADVARPSLMFSFSKSKLPLLSMAIPLFALAGCHSQQALTPQQTEGQHLYVARCAHCHEENDLALKPPPPQIHGVLQKAKLPSGIAASDAVVRHQIIYGKGKMPSFSGRFTEEQMAELLSYLHTSMPNPDLPAN